MKESNFQTLFSKYLMQGNHVNAVFELKLIKGNSIPFSSVKKHQVDGLLNAVQGMYYKISDSPIFPGMKTRFTSKKPFDCMYIKPDQSYVVIDFYLGRAKHNVIMIRLMSWIQEGAKSERKSLTLERAEQIGTRVNLSLRKKTNEMD